MKKLIALLLLVAVSGCTTVGNKFNPDDINQLKPKVSTIDDATVLLGPPMSETAMANGNILYQWQYAQGTFLGTGSGAHVAILFDQKGKMLKVQHKSSTKTY